MNKLPPFFLKIMLLLTVFALPALAQAAEPTSSSWWSGLDSTEKFTLLLLLIISAVIIGMMLVLLKVINTFIKLRHQEYLQKHHHIDAYAAEQAIAAEKVPLTQQWLNKLADAVPVSNEEDILLHHNYDGIRELDNNLPPWWVYMFYGSIIFAFVYVGHYHIFGTGPLSQDEYQEEMRIAAIQKEAYLKKVANMTNESNVTVLTDESSLALGKKNMARKVCSMPLKRWWWTDRS